MKKLLLGLLLLPMLGFSKTITLSEGNTINFNNKFSGQYVAEKQIEAITKCSANIGSDITVVLYTPGGSVSAGQLFFDTLKALPCNFNTLTIFSASMGYQTVQNLGKRYILPSGVLMSHRAYVSGLGGEVNGELDAILNLLKSNINELNKVAASRVGISLKQYDDLIRDELWMTGQQAVDMNHADEVVLAVCDKSLMGTRVQTFRTFFGSIDVEFSNCPLVVAPLRVVRSSNSKATKAALSHFTNIQQKVTTEL